MRGFMMGIKYEKWGNNEYHCPDICKDCESDCQVCSNGPRLGPYRRAEAESRLRDTGCWG